MRKLQVILLGIISLSLLIFALLSVNTSLTETDVKQITAIVQAQTTKPILSIEKQTDGTVRVSTGTERGLLDGGGDLFTLKRTFRGWKILRRGQWIS